MLNLRLNDYRQVYFDKEDRARIPAALIEEIRWDQGTLQLRRAWQPCRPGFGLQHNLAG